MHTVRFGHRFMGKSGVNSTGLALNPCSLYLGSGSFELWLPSTPQFGEFRISLCLATFVLLTYHAKIFRGL